MPGWRSGKPYFQSSGTFSMTQKHSLFPRKNYEVCIVFQRDDSCYIWTDKESAVRWKWGSKWPAEQAGDGSQENVLRIPLALTEGESGKEGSRRKRKREGGWKERKIRNKKRGRGKKSHWVAHPTSAVPESRLDRASHAARGRSSHAEPHPRDMWG